MLLFQEYMNTETKSGRCKSNQVQRVFFKRETYKKMLYYANKHT